MNLQSLADGGNSELPLVKALLPHNGMPQAQVSMSASTNDGQNGGGPFLRNDWQNDGEFSQQISYDSCATVSSFHNSAVGQLSRQCTALATEVLQGVNDIPIEEVLQAVADSCKFCVTVADPREDDVPLIAVSAEFEVMTGFSREEILGTSCRFLNQGCDVSGYDMAGMRRASETGCPFTALIPNRKKTGELFLNMLDLRGLTVAENRLTGEELWFLIGIQADVSEIPEEEAPEDHLPRLLEVANMIRDKLLDRGSVEAVSDELAADVTSPETSDPRDGSLSEWRILQELRWRVGERLDPMSPDLTAVSERSDKEVPPVQCWLPSAACADATTTEHKVEGEKEKKIESEMQRCPVAYQKCDRNGLVLLGGVALCAALVLYLQRDRGRRIT